MSEFPYLNIFAIMLAINLLVVGAVLTGGIALTFKLTENVSPRIRYYGAVAVFLTAIFLPFAATTTRKNFVNAEKISSSIGAAEQKNGMPIFVSSKDLSGSQKVESNSAENESWLLAGKNLSEEFLTKFILSFGNSFFGGIFLIVWVAGIFLLFIREAYGLRRISRMRKSWTLATGREREMLQLADASPLYFAVDQTPGTIGLLRPAIVLPRKFPAEISLEAQRFIVRHELAHVQRFDPLGNFILRALRNLFWVSPALWLIEKLIDAEREAAADRAAVERLPQNDYQNTALQNYAETLLLIAGAFKTFKQPQKIDSQLIGIGAGDALEFRVRRLLSSRRANSAQKISVLGVCFSTVVIISIIPHATFSKISNEHISRIESLNNVSETFSNVDQASESSPEKENDFWIQAAIDEKNKKLNQPSESLRGISSEIFVTAKTSVKVQAAQSKHQLLNFAREDERAESAIIFSGEPDVEDDRLKNQLGAAKLNDLEPLPATNSLNDVELKTLQSLRPASGLKTALSNEDESGQPKATSLTTRRTNNSAYYPEATAVPEREIYKSVSVSHPARRNEK